jgi:hypothetical protein
MSRPTSSTTLRPELGAIAYEYMLEASQRGFIGDILLPVFDTPLQTAQYPVIPIESLLKLQDTKRSPRADYNRGDYEFETGTYACEDHGWEELLDDSEAKLYRRFFDAEQVAVMRAVDIVLRAREARIAAMLQSTSLITGTAAVSTEWSTASSCTPRSDVMTARAAMRTASGLTPNVLAISYKVFGNLLKAKEITDALQYTNPLQVNSEEAQRRLLSQYFGMEVLVGNAIKDSAKKGQSMSIADIWDDEYALLARISSGSQDLREPCLGRTFLWTEDSPGILITEQYREEKKRSEVYRVRNNVDEAFIFTGAGYLLSNITA